MAVFKNGIFINYNGEIINPVSNIPAAVASSNFFQSAGITNQQQRYAVYNLVSDLQSYSIWDKMKAVYPFVGQAGVSSSFQFNLKDPNTFRGTFNGGWTYSLTGVTGNGVNGYMDTNFNPSLNFNNFNNGYSIYCRTNSSSSVFDFGAYPGFYVYLNYPSFGCRAAIQCQDSNRPQFDDNNSSGMFTFTNGGNNLRKAFRNGVLKNTNTTVDTTTRVNQTLPLGCLFENTYQGFSNREYAMLLLHDSLTDTEASNLYTAVQRFQTTLGRQV